MIKEKKKDGLEYLYHEGELYCIILRDSFVNDSVIFFTPDSFSQQMGYLPHKKGSIIKSHRHKINKREILYTHEVLFIKEGKIKVNFYDKNKKYLFSENINKGDVILLCGGGHGFDILENTIMIEIKQGPYVGIDDKERFEGIEEAKDDSC